MKPVLIDAAAALRILMSPNDKKADPHEQTSFIEQMSRSGHFRLWAFPGYATKSEPTPPEEACTLTFDWNARASEVDEQLGQLDLCGSDGKLVWRNVHFYEAEIEFARLFLLLALLILLRLAVSSREGREIEAARSDGGKGIAIDIEPPATAGKKRRRGPSHEPVHEWH